MADLTLLDSSHGFADGDIDTDGYVAVISAFQKIYYADGRDYDNKGYHKLDFANTKITASNVTTKLTRGEAVTQATSNAAGIYDENTDTILSGTQTGTFVLGEKVTQAVTLAIGYVVNVASGKLGVCPVSRNVQTGAPIDFTASGNTVTGATSGATIGTVSGVTAIGLGLYHFIYRTTTTEFDNSNAITGDLSGGVITPTAVTAPPHWLTWKPVASWVSQDASESTTNPGIMPDGGSNIGVLAYGRIFLNSMTNPHQWFCSRVFDPLDFDSSGTDVAAATTSQNAKAGEVGQPIVAMVGYKDYYIVWGCTNEVWIMRSDPLQGGVNTNVSKSTGFFSPTSWCWDDQNNLYFLGIDGIYKLTSEAIINAQPPENITKERNPRLVTDMGLNRRTDRVVKQRIEELRAIAEKVQYKVCEGRIEQQLEQETRHATKFIAHRPEHHLRSGRDVHRKPLAIQFPQHIGQPGHGFAVNRHRTVASAPTRCCPHPAHLLLGDHDGIECAPADA